MSAERDEVLGDAHLLLIEDVRPDERDCLFSRIPRRDELVAIAGNAPIHFHGYIDGRVALARHLSQADIALSVCPGETFGLAVLEALAAGTPVVTANTGGARELVDETCGRWGDANPAALADAVLELAGVPNRRPAARQRAELYDWDTCIQHMLNLHRRLALPLAA